MIEPDLVRTIAEKADSHGWDESAIMALRAAYPTVHLTHCLDDDILEGRPVLTCPGGNVYLVDGREHCLRLTDDYEAATGLVLAQCTEADEL